MKKILFVVNHFEHSNGVSRVLANAVNTLAKTNKYEVTLLVLYRVDDFVNCLDDRIKVKKFRNKYFRGLAKIDSVIPTKLLYKHLIKEKYDVEISFQAGVPTKLVTGSKNTNSKKVAWVHGLDLTQLKYHEKYDNVVTCSNSTREKFCEVFKFPNKVSSIHNIVKIPTYDLLNDNDLKMIKPYDFTLVTVGRLSVEKGFDKLLEIHKKLIDKGIFHNLWIVGDGPEKEKLVEYVTKNNLGKSCKLLGFNANPYQFYNKADLFVCSSLSEGLSTVMIESILCGLPAVSTNVDGAFETIVENNFGKVVNDYESLANVIEEFIVDSKKLEKFKQIVLEKNYLLSSEYQKGKLIDFFDKINS